MAFEWNYGHELAVNFIGANDGDPVATRRQVMLFLNKVRECEHLHEYHHRADEMLGFLFKDGSHYAGVLYFHSPFTHRSVPIGYDQHDRCSGHPEWVTPGEAWRMLDMSYNDG